MKQKLIESCTYQTPKIVRVIDRKIGLIYYGICLLIISYIVFYVLLYKKEYYQTEKTIGGSIIKPFGKLVGKDQFTNQTRVFDIGDYTRNIDETSAIFIATKIEITEGQQQKYCHITPCESDADCKNINQNPPISERICMSSGFCKQYAWCPVHNSNSTKNTKTFVMENLQDLHFEFVNVIQFGSEEEIEDIIYSTDAIEYDKHGEKKVVFYPEKRANALNMTEILINIDEDQSLTQEEYEKIINKGAIIKIVFDYYCDLRNMKECEPDISFQMLSEVGDAPVQIEDSLTYSFASNSSSANDQMRDLTVMTGIRLIFHVQGYGNTLSYASIILQISSALALLNIAATLCDLIMLYCPLLKKEHREKYFDYKIEDSEDFSNLQERVDLIEKEQEKRLKKIKKDRKKQEKSNQI
eukprot:403348942